MSSPLSARRAGPVSQPVGIMWLAPRAALRKGHARGNARWHPPVRARVRRSENVPVRRCLKNCCRSRKAVAIGPRDLPPSQADRCAGPSARRAEALREKRRKTRRKTRGTKRVGGRSEGERARGRGARTIGTSPSTARGKPRAGARKGIGTTGAITTAGSWVVCSCWHPRTGHGVERLRVEKRHLAMKGVLVRLSGSVFTTEQ